MKMKELVQGGWKLLDITNDEKLKAQYDSWCRKVKGFLKQNNFYLYYRSMFQNPLHKKATMSMDELKNLQRKKNMNAEDFCFCFLLNFLSSRSLMLFV